MLEGIQRLRPFYRIGAFALVLALSVLIAPGQADSALPQDPPMHGTDSHHDHTLAPGGLSPTGMTAEEEDAYSLFMHRSSGLALAVIGLLMLADRIRPRNWFRIAIALIWLGFGLHLFVRSDPEGWPIGPAGFLESFSMPTAGEWVQHKLLSLIPLALGIWTCTPRYRLPNPYWTYALGGLMVLGGGALLLHQHADHPGMDLVNLQHRFMALTALFIALGMLADGREGLRWKVKPFLLPCGLILLGFQLALYVE